MTFLFTDIEGSTQMAQGFGSQFRQIVEDHNGILQSAITAHGGVTVSTSGDSFFAVFKEADEAVLAALEAQRGLRSHEWPDRGQVRVRMGCHTGEGRLGGENYVGLDVITAARISAAANGGQLVVSDATRSSVVESGPRRIEFRDLGRHRLKGLEHPQLLFQVLSPGLPSDFPPLGSEGPPTNLPAPDSLFVGRELESSEVLDLLLRARLVTLLGPGGSGKTRLALHVASRAGHHFEGGVHLVGLNEIRDSDRVAPSIVEVIGASQVGDPVEAVVERVGSKSWLLILDGFEYLVSSAPVLNSLLESCERLTLLVTSQRLLRSRFERVYPVPPLGVPENSILESVRTSEGGSLFESRVASVDPSFVLTEKNASDVADIVTGVEGLPLAIELAAARVRLLGLARLREEVEDSISVLSGGFADDAARHRSMEAAIAWSYGMLDPSGQALFNRCSRFLGGFTLDALDVVCRGEPVVNVHDTMTQLLDSSLVHSTMFAGNVRFGMLEPLRKFGLRRLEETGELSAIARRHAEHYIPFVSETAASFHGPDHYSAMERVGSERANLTAALEWSIVNDPDLGLKALVDLSHSFPVVGALAEGHRLAERLLDGGGSPPARLTGLLGAGAIAYWLNDYETAEAHYREAVDLSSRLGNEAERVEALYGRAFSLVWLGRPDQAEEIADSIPLPEDENEKRLNRGVLALKAFVEWMHGNLGAAGRKFEEIISLSHKSGDESQELFYQLAMSGISVLRGEADQAIAVQLGALQRFSELQDEGGMVHALDWLAHAVTSIDPRDGLVMAAGVDALRRRRGGFIDLTRLGMVDPREMAAGSLSSEEIDLQWSRGRELDLTGVEELALEWASLRELA